MKKQLIVVTGGSGFIGSSLIRHLNDQEMTEIVVVDELGLKEKWKNLVGKKIEDIVEKKDFFPWLQSRQDEIKAIVHLGACSSTVEKDASYLLENNYKFSVKLAEYALKYDKRFIYASSAATYGDGEKGFKDDESAIDGLYPLNMYGFSKQLFDLWVKNQGVLNKLVGLKYFNVFGPNEGHKGRMASAIYHFLGAIKNKGKVSLFKSDDARFEDGGQKRDFIYVKDAAKMTAAFLDNSAAGIFNIGSGVASSWNMLVHALFKALDKEAEVEYIPMPEDLVGKYQSYTCADMEKTKSILKELATCRPLDEAVEDYTRNYLLPNKHW